MVLVSGLLKVLVGRRDRVLGSNYLGLQCVYGIFSLSLCESEASSRSRTA
jgi:hypothetical protein